MLRSVRRGGTRAGRRAGQPRGWPVSSFPHLLDSVSDSNLPIKGETEYWTESLPQLCFEPNFAVRFKVRQRNQYRNLAPFATPTSAKAQAVLGRSSSETPRLQRRSRAHARSSLPYPRRRHENSLCVAAGSNRSSGTRSSQPSNGPTRGSTPQELRRRVTGRATLRYIVLVFQRVRIHRHRPDLVAFFRGLCLLQQTQQE